VQQVCSEFCQNSHPVYNLSDAEMFATDLKVLMTHQIAADYSLGSIKLVSSRLSVCTLLSGTVQLFGRVSRI
jgi:hypothetical protein